MDINLKQCPFCGCKAKISESGKYFRIECSAGIKCPIEPRTHWFESKFDAIKDWNTRKE